MNEKRETNDVKTNLENMELRHPIFIVGLPRTGSTLWHNIISMNPNVFRLTEMRYLSSWHKDFRYFMRKQAGDLTKEYNVEKMINLFLSRKEIPGLSGAFWRFENIDVINEPELRKEMCRRIMASDKSLGSIFKILIEEITRFSGYSRCCVKFPVYVHHVPQLLQWYPDCKIIHIIRDPRAMAASRTNDPSGTALRIKKHPRLGFIIKKIMILSVVVQYIWTSRLHQKYKNNKNYALFRYEDLLANPEKVIKELCEFAEIDYIPEMVEPQKGYHEHQASSLTGKKQKKIDVKSASRWKEVISPSWNRFVTYLTKNSMKRFAYDPENHPVFDKTE